MELKDYIKMVLEQYEDVRVVDREVFIEFEVGLNPDGKTVDHNSSNRVKFTIQRKEEDYNK